MERMKIAQNIMIDEATVKEMEDAVFTNLKALKYLKQLGMDDETIKDTLKKLVPTFKTPQLINENVVL